MSSETKIINPHEAIRVTRLEVAYIPRVDKQPKLHLMYRLIWERSVESCMANAIYDITKLSMTSPWDRYFYTASLEIPTFLGWQKVATTMDTDTVARISSMKLFLTQVKDGLLPIHMETVVRETNHGKPYYSESTLIHRLEEYGIGRPSTYALIVHTLIDREYIKVQDVSGSAVTYKHFYLDTPQNIVCEIEKEIILGSEKRRLVIQPLGVSVIQYLIEHFEHLFSYDYTRNMEDTLDLVDETNWMDICVHCKNTIVPPQTIYQSITPRPTNDSVLRYVTTDISIRTAKYGPYIYYKTQKMGKPAFYSITKCKLSYMDCSSEELISWMSKTYNRKF
jgi:DNA topoisomerase-1